MLTKKIFDDCIEEIEIAFANFTMTKSRASIWYKYSKHLNDKKFKTKVENCIRGCRKSPTLGDILDQKNYFESVTPEQEWEHVKHEERITGDPIPKDVKDKMDKILKRVPKKTI